MCERINEMVSGDGEADKYAYRAILFYGRPSATITFAKYPKAHSELICRKKVELDLFYVYSRFTMLSPSSDDLKKRFFEMGFSYAIIPNLECASHGIMTLLTHQSIRPPFGKYQTYTC